MKKREIIQTLKRKRENFFKKRMNILWKKSIYRIIVKYSEKNDIHSANDHSVSELRDEPKKLDKKKERISKLNNNFRKKKKQRFHI